MTKEIGSNRRRKGSLGYDREITVFCTGDTCNSHVWSSIRQTQLYSIPPTYEQIGFINSQETRWHDKIDIRIP